MRKTVHSRAQRTFCRLVVAARKSAGLTQVELARRLNKPQSFVAKIEAGERRVDVVELLVLAEALDTDAGALIRKLVDGLKS